jgi:hypothetical protein
MFEEHTGPLFDSEPCRSVWVEARPGGRCDVIVNGSVHTPALSEHAAEALAVTLRGLGKHLLECKKPPHYFCGVSKAVPIEK